MQLCIMHLSLLFNCNCSCKVRKNHVYREEKRHGSAPSSKESWNNSVTGNGMCIFMWFSSLFFSQVSAWCCMDYNTEKREKASLFLPVKICEVSLTWMSRTRNIFNMDHLLIGLVYIVLTSLKGKPFIEQLANDRPET